VRLQQELVCVQLSEELSVSSEKSSTASVVRAFVALMKLQQLSSSRWSRS
jgi:hypothetical protein